MKITIGELRSILDEATKKDPLLPGTSLTASSLRKGMKVAASYNAYNHGIDIVEILGVGTEDKIMFDSVKEAMKAMGVKSMRALSDLDERKPAIDDHDVVVPLEVPTRLWVKTLGEGRTGGRQVHEFDINWLSLEKQQQESGPFYYIYEGRWARGSGAEKLSFTTIPVDIMKKRMEKDEFRKPDEMLLNTFKEHNLNGDVLDFAWFIYQERTFTMPEEIRQTIDDVSGYDQKTQIIDSVDAANEVSRALYSIPNDAKMGHDWLSSINYIERMHAIAADIVSAALAMFS